MADHNQLVNMRVAQALRNLNDALGNAHRLGLRTHVAPTNDGDRQKVKVTMMRPVALKLEEGA